LKATKRRIIKAMFVDDVVPVVVDEDGDGEEEEQ
jgi:hypothetical protein